MGKILFHSRAALGVCPNTNTTYPSLSHPNPHDPGPGWEKTEEGSLEPVWSCGPILPSSLIDLLEKTAEEVEESEEEEEEQEIDYEELLNDDD